MGVLMPKTYSVPQHLKTRDVKPDNVGISFDSSKIAAAIGDQRVFGQYICVWDLPSGTLLYSLNYYAGGTVYKMKWSRTEQYLRLKSDFDLWYLNAETFQNEILEHPGDRFRGPNRLHYDKEKRDFRLSSEREGPPFFALPSHFDARCFSSRGDRACIVSKDGRFLLLDTSSLEAYMVICNLKFQSEVSRMKECWFFVIEIIINPIGAGVSDDADSLVLYGKTSSRFMYLYLLSHWTLHIIQ